MMDDPAPETGPLTTEEFWTSLIFLLVLVGLFAAEICVNYHPAKLTALFVILAWVPLLAVHEAGHALVAVLLGWRVHAVVIGMGRPLARFRVGRTPVEIRMVPVEGFVLPAPTNLRAPRLKSALIYFAGPGAELLVVALLVLAFGLDRFLSRTDNLGLLAAQSVAVAALASAFFNLVPHYAVSQSGRIPNDGLGIILSFLRPREDYARQLAEPDVPWKAEPEWEPEADDRWR
jgi:membrane-associated protease RseP (regulator of RpoE activity)